MTRDAGRRGSRRSNGTGAAPQSGQRAPSREDRGRLAGRKRPADFAGSIGKIAILLVLAGGVGIIAYNALRGGAAVGVAVVEPATLSTLARNGKTLFEANCAACHGQKGGGTDHGPPFVNDIYNPGHHSDAAFVLAARSGVRAHHWRFGNMPPVAGLTDPNISAIVRYVRELQEANGISFKPHTM